MSFVRYSVVSVIAAALGGALAGAPLVACGGDGEAAPAPDPAADSGATPDAAVAPTGPEVLISEVRTKLYLGHTAKIDVAAVAPALVSDITWQVIDAPVGSLIDTASIQGTANGTPTFTPDLLGLYTFQVTGKKDGETASVLVFVEAVDAPIFWRELSGVMSGGVESYRMSTQVGGAHGSAPRAVACAELPSAAAGSARYGALTGDVWEASAGTPSRVVYPDALAGATEGSYVSALSVATSDSTCDPGSVAPKPLYTSRIMQSVPDDLDGVIGARFSPDGSRVAFSYNVSGKSRLATIGFDGSAKHELSPYQGSATAGGGLDPNGGMSFQTTVKSLVQPRWKDATHVAWITSVGGAQELYVIEDREGATAELFMRCSASVLTTFDFTADGSIVATAISSKVADLVVLQPNATTKECEVTRNFTNNQDEAAIARDLALSPDKTTVAFYGGVVEADAGPPEQSGAVFTVPVDGSKPPARIPGSSVGVQSLTSPRWVAGGTMITWGNNSGEPSYGSIVAIPSAGGVEQEVTRGTSVLASGFEEHHVVLAFGQGGCSITRGASPIGARGWAGGGLGILVLVARRRRRARGR